MGNYRRIDFKRKPSDVSVIACIEAKDKPINPGDCHHFFETHIGVLMRDEELGRLNRNDTERLFGLLKEASKKGYSPMQLPPEYRSFAHRCNWYF